MLTFGVILWLQTREQHTGNILHDDSCNIL